MAIDNPNVIDIVGISREKNEVVLTIADHLEWEEEDHLFMLQEKLNQYLDFIENGELLERFPKAKDKLVRIEVCCKYAPTDAAERFLNQARRIIEDAGWSFSWRVPVL